jgi:hypothetical protein
MFSFRLVPSAVPSDMVVCLRVPAAALLLLMSSNNSLVNCSCVTFSRTVSRCRSGTGIGEKHVVKGKAEAWNGIKVSACRSAHGHCRLHLTLFREIIPTWEYKNRATAPPPSYCILRSILVSFNVLLGLPSGRFPPYRFSNKVLHVFLVFSVRATCPACLMYVYIF